MVAILLGADNGFFYAGQIMHFSSPFTVFLIYHKHLSLFCPHCSVKSAPDKCANKEKPGALRNGMRPSFQYSPLVFVNWRHLYRPQNSAEQEILLCL